MSWRTIGFAMLTALLAVSGAHAQQPGLSHGPGGAPGQAGRGLAMRAACGQDVRALCAGVQPGQGRIVQCLASHHGDLSVNCKSMLQQARQQRSAARADSQTVGRSQPGARIQRVPNANPAAAESAIEE
jgi:hypothetical protein